LVTSIGYNKSINSQKPTQEDDEVMKVNQVSVTIKYSKEEHGAWRTIELGAEATIDPEENWEAQQTQLYAQLGQQLRELWRGPAPSASASSGPNTVSAELSPQRDQDDYDLEPEPLQTAPSARLAKIEEHWCEAHGVEFRRYEKEGRAMYAHKTEEGVWCREKESNQRVKG
jgi:hypothetical protein